MIGINDYQAAFPVSKASDNIGETDISEIFLNSMTNGLSKHAYMKGFDCEDTTFKHLLICLKAW